MEDDCLNLLFGFLDLDHPRRSEIENILDMFIFLILFGSFFLMNVLSAVVATNYGVQMELSHMEEEMNENASLILQTL